MLEGSPASRSRRRTHPSRRPRGRARRSSSSVGPGTYMPWSASSTSSTYGDSRRAMTPSHIVSAVPPTTRNGAVARSKGGGDPRHGQDRREPHRRHAALGRERRGVRPERLRDHQRAAADGVEQRPNLVAHPGLDVRLERPGRLARTTNADARVAPRRSATADAYMSNPAAGPNVPPGTTTASAMPPTIRELRGQGMRTAAPSTRSPARSSSASSARDSG